MQRMILAAAACLIFSLAQASVPVKIKKAADRRAVLEFQGKHDSFEVDKTYVLAPASEFIDPKVKTGDSLSRNHRVDLGMELTAGENTGTSTDRDSLNLALSADYVRNFGRWEVGAELSYSQSSSEDDDGDKIDQSAYGLALLTEFNFKKNAPPNSVVPGIGVAYRMLNETDKYDPDEALNAKLDTSEIDAYFIFKVFHWSYNAFSMNYALGYRLRYINADTEATGEGTATQTETFIAFTLSYYFDRVFP